MFRGEAKKRQGLHLLIGIKSVIYLQETVITLPFRPDLEENGVGKMSSVLLACPACKKRISSSAHTCPNCGETLSDQWEAQGRTRLRRQRYAAWAALLGTAACVVVYKAENRSSVKSAGIISSMATSDAIRIERPAQAEIKQAVNQALAANRQQPMARSCLLYTSPSPRDRQKSRMPSSA